jgi:hypothetical protein
LENAKARGPNETLHSALLILSAVHAYLGYRRGALV